MRRDLSWKELVEKSWGKELHAPDIAYEFSGFTSATRIFYDRKTPHHGDGIVDASNPSLYADNYADNYA